MFITPLSIIDINKTATQINHEIEHDFNTPSTRLKSTYYLFPEDSFISKISDDILYSTPVFFGKF